MPVVLTPDVQRGLDMFRPWLAAANRPSFIVVGPEGCGKELLLRHSFEQLRSVQVATIHCSAQNSATHVIQKLMQVCMVISTNTGRVYRPRDSERLILYLKDLNLPKPDKWGTSQLIAFLQQVRWCVRVCVCDDSLSLSLLLPPSVPPSLSSLSPSLSPPSLPPSPLPSQVITYNGFYDNNLEWVGLEAVQIVASMNAGNTLGKHSLSTRFTSIARICCIE